MAKRQNPFKAPVTPEDDDFGIAPADANPIGALEALAGEVRPAAAAATAALTGKKVQSETPKANAHGTPRGPNSEADPFVFQKGFLKGIDKQVFLAMLGDGLTAIGGGESQGMTKQAIEARRRRMELRQRQQELADQRDFDREQQEARRALEREKIDSKETDADLDRKSSEKIAQARITAQTNNMERNAVLEQEARDGALAGDGHARIIASYFDDINTMPDVYLEPNETFANALKDDEIAHSVWMKTAPVRERRLLDKLEAQNAKAGKRQREVVLPAVERATDFWRQGKVEMTNPDTGVTSVVSSGAGSLQERTDKILSAMPPNEIMSDSIMEKEMGDAALQLLDEFHNLDSGAFWSLDRGLRNMKNADAARMIDSIFKGSLRRAREAVREELLDPKNFPTPETPEEKARRLQREAEGQMSATGGTSR